MNQYANEEYYFDTFLGTSIPAEELDKYLKLASEKIDDVTFNRIVKIGFGNLTEFQKTKIQDAVCYQAEYIMLNGYNDEDKEDVASYSVLDISITKKDSSEAEKTEAEKNYMSEVAYNLIKKTGLTCKVIR